MQGHSARVSFSDHLQLLFSAALQFLDQPFPPKSPEEEDQLSTELENALSGLDTLEQGSDPPPDQLPPNFTDFELRELLGLDELPSTGTTAPPASPAESNQPLPAAQAAAVYTVYALFKAQPTTSKPAAHTESGGEGGASTSAVSSAASVPIYLPLGLLQELTKLLHSKPGSDLWPIVVGLWRSNAFVLGAARQPPLWRHSQPAR